MPGDDAGELLDQVGRGDPGAAERLFRLYRPYLLAVVRRQRGPRFRSRFDSSDVVQSVWVQVVRQLGEEGWPVASEAELRGLLAVIARRRLASRARREECRPEEGPLAEGAEPPAHFPRASEVAQAGETWEQMLELCPPAHRPLLQMRRDGLTLAEIADRAGLHEGSVRRVFRQLARALALRGHPLPAGGEGDGE